MIPIIWVLRMCPATINKDVHKDKKFIVLTEMTVCVSVFILWVIYRQYSMYQAWQPGRLIEGGAHLLTSKMKCTHSHQPFNTYIRDPAVLLFGNFDERTHKVWCLEGVHVFYAIRLFYWSLIAAGLCYWSEISSAVAFSLAAKILYFIYLMHLWL